VKAERARWFEARKPMPVDGNEVTLLQAGAEFFPALLDAVGAARRHVWIETYIYADDDTGRRIAAALAAAAARGVEVRLLVDGFGTRQLPPAIDATLREAGVAVRTYAPVRRLLTLNRERLRRLHRKLACIDGAVGFVGGINILDDLWDPNHGALDHPRLDYAVHLRGPIVADVHYAMARLWWQLSMREVPRRLTGRGGTGPADVRPPGWLQLPDSRAKPIGHLRAMLVLRDNLAFRRSIESAYLKALGGARREALIANAYFFPGRRFRRALKAAASRGVRVRLLLQGRIEYPLPHLASQALYDELLRAGVEIVEYHRSFMHAKVAVIDDWATVGSSNIDPFSLLLSREANVMVFDAGFAKQLREQLLESIQEGGAALALTQHAARPWTRRLLNWLAYRLLRLGVTVSGAARRPY
jgi:cardiolipin synthase A/B